MIEYPKIRLSWFEWFVLFMIFSIIVAIAYSNFVRNPEVPTWECRGDYVFEVDRYGNFCLLKDKISGYPLQCKNWNYTMSDEQYSCHGNGE